MLNTKHFIILFIPAIAIIGFGLYSQIGKYTPAGLPKPVQENEIEQLVPLFPEDPISGSKKSPATIIAFEDLACPGCKAQASVLDELVSKHDGKVKVIWKLLSVTTFPYATVNAHAYAFCANQQKKFGDFKQMAFANHTNLTDDTLKLIAAEINLNENKLTSCLTSEAPAAYAKKMEQTAIDLHIQAVPTLFLNNKQIAPPTSIAQWEQLLGL